MSKKMNWAEIDKRVRDRRTVWSQQERSDLNDSLKRLPDATGDCDTLELSQPALAGSNGDSEAN
jgi:hypothetical protein